MLTREEAAVAMGMKVVEVVEVVAGLGDTTIVTTHDGVRTMVTADGRFLPYSGSPAPVADTTVPVDPDEPPVVPPAVPVDPSVNPQGDSPVNPSVSPTVDPDEGGDVPDNVDIDGDGVPDGPASGVLAWVGTDSQRAAAALVAERARDKPRTGLIATLEKLVSS